MFERQSKYFPLKQPYEIPEREKEDAMGAYLMMFASLAVGLPFPVINLIASVIYYFLNRDKSRFVNFHATQSVLSQLPISILNSASIIWAIRVIFFDLSPELSFFGFLAFVAVANIIYFIFSIIAAVKARKGIMYYFIFFGRVAYDNAYLRTSAYNTRSA